MLETYYILPEKYYNRIDSNIMSVTQKTLELAKRNNLIPETMQAQFFGASYCLCRIFPELKQKHALCDFTTFNRRSFVSKYKPSSESMRNIIWLNLAMDEPDIEKFLLSVAFLISEDRSKEYEICTCYLSGEMFVDQSQYPDKEQYQKIMSAVSKAEALINKGEEE